MRNYSMNKTTTAKDLGAAAFKNGAPRVPGLDTVLFANFLTGAQVGDKEASRAMRDWLAGWDEANLRDFQWLKPTALRDPRA